MKKKRIVSPTRPFKAIPKAVRELFCALLENGVSVDDAAARSGTAKATWYRLIDRDAKFRLQVETARAKKTAPPDLPATEASAPYDLRVEAKRRLPAILETMFRIATQTKAMGAAVIAADWIAKKSEYEQDLEDQTQAPQVVRATPPTNIVSINEAV